MDKEHNNIQPFKNFANYFLVELQCPMIEPMVKLTWETKRIDFPSDEIVIKIE